MPPLLQSFGKKRERKEQEQEEKREKEEIKKRKDLDFSRRLNERRLGFGIVRYVVALKNSSQKISKATHGCGV